MSEKVDILKKLVETVGGKVKCNEKVVESVCLEVEAVFQHSESTLWFPSCDDVRERVIKAVISLVQHASPMQLLSNGKEEEAQRISTLTASTATIILSDLYKGQRSSPDDAIERAGDAQRLVRAVVMAAAPHCLVLVAMQREQHPWTSAKSRHACEGLMTVICKMSDCDSVAEVLSEGPTWCREAGNGGLFREVVGLLKGRLTRDDWHKEPVTRQAFKWCLLQMKHPYLGEYLNSVLPPSLLFVDDYKVNNKILGVYCMQHIIDNVDPTELRWYDRATVIYEALHPLLYNQKPALINQLLPCLISILAVIVRSPHKADIQRKPNRYDSVLQTVLRNMEFEQRLVLRQAYAKHLHLFIDSMGITVLGHMKQLLRVILKYLEAFDGEDDTSKMCTLTSLNSLIHQTWPRISNHWEAIMKVLLKLLLSVCDNYGNQIEKDVRQSLKDRCVDCLVLLRRCCGADVGEALKAVLAICSEDNIAMKPCIEKVLAS